MAKSFYDLSEKDILALAISLEEEDVKDAGLVGTLIKAKAS